MDDLEPSEQEEGKVVPRPEIDYPGPHEGDRQAREDIMLQAGRQAYVVGQGPHEGDDEEEPPELLEDDIEPHQSNRTAPVEAHDGDRA